MSQPTICNFCYDHIVCTRVSWGYHHLSYLSLANSASKQCAFCTILHEDVLICRQKIEQCAVKNESKVYQSLEGWFTADPPETRKLHIEHSTSALHRWSVRSLGRTRETKVVVAVSFRPISRPLSTDVDVGPTSEPQTFGLPERVFFCFPEDDIGRSSSLSDPGTTTNPESNGRQIESWIRTCSIEHKYCPKRAGAASKFVPTRLRSLPRCFMIDKLEIVKSTTTGVHNLRALAMLRPSFNIGGKRRPDRIRVMDTKANKIKGPYVTLSHCWGHPDPARKDSLRSKNMNDLMNEGVLWCDLSTNFRQAIEVARFMEVDYIWIDSLCILQGEDAIAKADWKREGSSMHKVYRNSYCNIAAADARNGEEGLFRERHPQRVLPTRFEADGTSPVFGIKVWRALRADLWENDLLCRPLYTRAWVFQERMLSPRILHFGEHQIFWDCAAMSACEALPSGLPLPLDTRSATERHWRGRLQEAGTSRAVLLTAANDDSLDNFWKMAVDNYTSLDLTFQTDKRTAIWGIAKLVRDSLDEEYAAGLWEVGLEEQLAWRVTNCTVAERPEELKKNPSWSWTSIKGQIVAEGRSQQYDRTYWVKNHEGGVLSFAISQDYARPVLSRDWSESFEEEVLAMGRDLKRVEERRQMSSSNSRHTAQTGTPQLEKRGQGGEISHESDQDPEGGKQTYGDVMERDSGRTVDFRDAEPELKETHLAIQGYLHQGLMRLKHSTGAWMIDLTNAAAYPQADFVLDAFPDIKKDQNDEHITFMILVLTRQVEQDGDSLIYDAAAHDERYVYVGHGLILSSTGRENEYLRKGAFKVRRLSEELWQRLQLGSDHTSEDAGSKDPECSNIFLV